MNKRPTPAEPVSHGRSVSHFKSLTGNDDQGHLLTRLFVCIVPLVLACLCAETYVLAADAPPVKILYPRPDSLVNSRVNLVLDPAADWSKTPFFQAVVNNKTEYPVIDSSTGKHASQGLALQPGANTITVRFIIQVKNEKNLTVLKTYATRDLRVYNREASFKGAPPAGFTQALFHSREHEAECSGCHRMEATSEDYAHKKPEDVLCFTCHNSIPTGIHVHGPAAVWNCLGCHDPAIYPVKYQFLSFDPWRVAKTVQPVEPVLYTLSSTELFMPSSAVLVSRNKALEILKDVIAYVKASPGDRVRIEGHTDNGPKKGKGFVSNEALSAERAKAVAALLEEAKIAPARNITAVGMGDTLPKADNGTQEGRELNNRVEVVVYPADVAITNSRNLPLLTDRERVLISMSYTKGPRVEKITLTERIPSGVHYLKGSGHFQGSAKEPRAKDSDLVWDLGNMDGNFSETLSYVVKKDAKGAQLPAQTKITYVLGSKQYARVFDQDAATTNNLTVKEVCLKCHGEVLAKTFKHGPTEAGYCTLCHDPHASNQRFWLRKSTWDVCTTCHSEKASGVHVITGLLTGITHPTRLKSDPLRPGRRLTCSSCHDPHSAESKDLFAYDIRNRNELCTICHRKK